MNPSERAAALEKLLRETGHAHHQAFAATNGDDPDWPQWYARYLADKLSPLLGARLSERQIAELLVAAEAEHRTHSPAADWPRFYSDFLLSRLAG